MSTHNICFCGEIRYQHFSDENSTLSVAMRHHQDMTEIDVKSKQNKYGKPEPNSVDPDRQKTMSISLLLF